MRKVAVVVVVLLWLGGSGWAVWRYYDTEPKEPPQSGGVTAPSGASPDPSVGDGVVVPDAVGRPAMAGAVRLQGAGLAVTVVTSPSILVPDAIVIEQQPEGGAEVAPGTVVELTVSTGPP